MARIILKCPNCGQRGHIRTRLKKNDRICTFCGYAGDPKEFEEKPEEIGREK